MDQVSGSDICGLMIERMPGAVAIFDADMRYISCNARWLSDFRLTQSDIIGRSHYAIFPEIGDALKRCHMQGQTGEAISSGNVEPFVRADGSLDWVKWELAPWRQHSGEIGGIILFAEVVPEPEDDRRNIDVLTAELDLLIDKADRHAIFLLDDDGLIRAWNVGAQRMFGWSSMEINGKSHTLLFRAADSDLLNTDLLVQASLNGGAFRGQLAALRKDGSQFMAEVAVDVVAGGIQKFARRVVAVHDLSAEIVQAESPTGGDSYHRAILESVPEAMVTIDQHGVILWFSHTAEKMFGYRAGEVIGHNVSMLMSEADAARHDEYLANYRTTGVQKVVGTARRVFGRRKDGSLFPHALCIGEANDGGSRIFTGFLRDLSQQEDAENKVRELQAELVHMSRVLAVGTMAGALAHELNQPLTAIANYVQTSSALLADASDDLLKTISEALDMAGKEALRAGGIIHRLRDFVTSGELERSIVSPAELAAQALDLGAVDARAHDISYKVAIPQNLPRILVDRVQVQQVLLNLIRNAMEAMVDHGSLAIDARRTGDMIRFRVSDNGPGVEPGQEEAIFEPFISSKASGLGMGLAICRTIITAHGGTMWCEQTPGGGATFYFTVPIGEVKDA